ncbi:hypothetical protein D1632_00235 [Chryseobacterium nematophagum]|uniref:Uncharacterized protein n=1 Tax=Chryseobacterium nematophagum TaxID=2305228 RepID=A0A3M7LGM5_9FLAO|nr:hypothetical protein D1632_00235 [Chryseobacterium nematophagum]
MPMSREMFRAKNWSGESARNRGSFLWWVYFLQKNGFPKNYRKEILRKIHFKFASKIDKTSVEQTKVSSYHRGTYITKCHTSAFYPAIATH